MTIRQKFTLLGIQHSGLKIDEIEWRGDENWWENL